MSVTVISPVFHICDFVMWGMDSGPLGGHSGPEAHWAPPQELKSKAEKGVLDGMCECVGE
jgi:hypothetical protein